MLMTSDTFTQTPVGALCLHRVHTTGASLGLAFSAFEHAEATRYVNDEKAKGIPIEMIFSVASGMLIKSLNLQKAGPERFFAAACVVAGRKIGELGIEMNCLTADEHPSGLVIGEYFLCAY